MTYNEFINSIIESRGQWNIPDGTLYENHHILPRCKGGLPLQWSHATKHENLIWLTFEEHYIAHKLLAEENPNDRDLNCAWWAMCTINGVKEIITPEDYAKAREAAIALLISNRRSYEGEANPNYGNTWSDEKVAEFSASRMGEGNPMYGRINTGRRGKSSWLAGLTKETDERVMKLSIAQTGRIMSDTARANMSAAAKQRRINDPTYFKGENHPFYGKATPNSVSIKCIELNKIYRSISEAAKELNIPTSSLSTGLRNKPDKPIHGYTFIKLNGEEVISE